MKSLILLSFIVGASFFSLAQQLPFNPLFDETNVNAMFVWMDEDSLYQLYSDVQSNHEYKVTFAYDDGAEIDTVEDVGFRLRGNTSRYSAKKSFRVSFNTFEQGKKYHDIEKLNLNGSHNDPSLIREKLFYDVWNRLGMPVRRSSFVRVYINNIYYGLYTNLEEIDEVWCKDRYGDNSGNLYKCTYPADLVYLGPDEETYKNIFNGVDRAYDLKTNEASDDYTDLVNLITILNQTPLADLPCELEKIFNADEFLQAYALDISSGNWDNYGFNKNNFFLYHNQFTHQFEFVAYDCDNTFGVDWINEDWGTRNIYEWENQNEDRPLVSRLLQVTEYKDRLSYYLQQIINGALLPANIDPHIDSMKNLITNAALDDVFRTFDYGYDDDDFFNSFNTNNIDSHTPYGIKNFIETRKTNTSNQLVIHDIVPVISNEQHLPLLPAANDAIDVTAEVMDDGSVNNVKIYYCTDSSNFTEATMYDDGNHADGLAADHIYGIELPPSGANGFIYYHFQATDNSSHIGRFPVCFDLKYKIGFESPLLFVNEFMASNNTTVTDNAGEFDDYVELYNGGTTAIYLGDKYLSDDFSNPSRWRLPDVSLGAGNYLLLWADNDPGQGNGHADFGLDAGGEQIGLFSSVSDYFAVIDTFTFYQQEPDVSMGRLPNGSGLFIILPGPTPGYDNSLVGVGENNGSANSMEVISNPSSGPSVIQLVLKEYSAVDVKLYSTWGVLQKEIIRDFEKGTYTITLDNPGLSPGVYFVSALINDQPFVRKLVIQ